MKGALEILWEHIEHAYEHPTEHVWNTMVNVNAIFVAIAVIFLIYSTGASIYYLTPRPFLWAVLILFILICIEVLFGVFEEQFD